MSVQINLIAGFLEAGKTSFIQNLIQDSQFRDGKKTVLLCCEQGLEEYRDIALRRGYVTLIGIDHKKELTADLFKDIIARFSPDRILIEYNGMWSISDFLKLRLPSSCRINKIVCVADASTFLLYMGNMSNVMSEQFSNSDMIFLNRDMALGEDEKNNIVRTLKNLNKKVKIEFYLKSIKENYINQIIDTYEVQALYKGIKAFFLVIPLLSFYLLLLSLRQEGSAGYVLKIKTLNTAFISILIQAVPFILIGVFISSFLQVFISDDIIVSLFTRYKWLGFPLTILLGVVFPVCDCAMAPITGRLVRKGVPLHYAVTFMLVAPAVNPIVIVSTIYAFPNDRRVVLLRIGAGILVAMLAGIFIKYGKFAKEYALNQSGIDAACASGYLGNIGSKGLIGKFEAMFRHAGLEFLNVSKFVVIGALITSIIQAFISQAALAAIGTSPMLSLLIMLLAAAVMSVCSSSNAFIARSFSYNFPLYSVLAYMIMGPMLDIKNILMLSGNFRKKFLAELLLILFACAVFVFSLLSILIQ